VYLPDTSFKFEAHIKKVEPIHHFDLNRRIRMSDDKKPSQPKKPLRWPADFDGAHHVKDPEAWERWANRNKK